MASAAHDMDSYDVFVILPEPTLRFAMHRSHVKALRLHADGNALTGVDAFYRNATDTAMLGLRFDPELVTSDVIARIIEVARSAELPILQPERLPVRDQRRFYEAYLSTYDRRVRGLQTPDAAMRLLARWLGIPTSPPNGAHDDRAEEISIDVHFRRGDAWQLGRLCSLTPGAIYVASGIPPRAGDVIDLEISHGDDTVPLKGVVVQVTALDAATTLGVAGFGARFVEIDRPVQGRLEAMLARSGAGERLVAQPPRRRHVRYPVRVPIAVEFLGAQLVTVALDLSVGGAFVKTPLPPLRERLAVSLALPGEEAPVQARAHVARTISEETAFDRGVSPGFGVEMMSMPRSDEDRLKLWLAGVARRAGCAVLVAGAPARVGELIAELAAVGYAATGVGQLEALPERIRASGAPDAIVIDSSGVEPPALDEATNQASASGARVIVVGAEPPAVVRTRVDEQVASV